MIFLLCLLVVLVADLAEPWSAVVIIVGAVLEVGEVAVLRAWSKRLGRRYRAKQPGDELVGLEAEVVSACQPEGQVKVRGEIWQARCSAGAGPGATVRVSSVDGLTLVVEPSPGP